MPTEKAVCDLFNVSRITVRKAYDALSQNGYIRKEQGKGSFVNSKEAGLQLNQLCGFSEEMRLLGKEPSTRLIRHQVIAPGDQAKKALMMEAGQKVHVFERLRCADGVPMALEAVHLPFHLFPDIENHDITQSLYKLLMEQYYCNPSRAEQSIRADLAGPHAERHLKVKSGKPVLTITRVTFDQYGTPFEYVESTYRGDRYAFHVSLGAKPV